ASSEFANTGISCDKFMNIIYEIPVLPSVNRDLNKTCYETVAPKNNLLPPKAGRNIHINS
ncbi:MAG TPA: hypothetical protein PK341_04295, partial [Spirochaetota bacterium]|nr:hypothetical protein [Spirochaetota bacterium]